MSKPTRDTLPPTDDPGTDRLSIAMRRHHAGAQIPTTPAAPAAPETADSTATRQTATPPAPHPQPPRLRRSKGAGIAKAKGPGRQAIAVDTTVERTVYNRAEAAAYMGLHPATFWQLAQRGDVPHIIVGRGFRYLREDLDRYLHGQPPRPDAKTGWEIGSRRKRGGAAE
jgi:excisionase family DNA binding protein